MIVANLLLATATTYYGRRFQIDETWYKSAGLHLAQDGRFAAPEVAGAMPGRVDAGEVFASQPPLYPLGFAGVVRAFGFGPDQVIGYDAALRGGLSLATFALLSAVGPGRWTAAGIAMLVWPLGTDARPDELGMVFGVAAVLLAARAGPATAIGAGVALGASAATSVGCGIVYGLAVLAVSGRRRWRRSAAVGAVSAAVATMAVAPVWFGHPGSIDQFRANSREATDLHGFAGKWRAAAHWVNPAWPVLAGLAAVVLVRAGRAVRRGHGGSMVDRLATAAAVSFGFVLVRLPGKYPYLWMVAPFATAAVYGWVTAAGPRPVRRLVAGGLLILVGIGSALPARDGLLAVLCPADLRPRAAVARLRRLVPDGSVVLCDEAWPMLGDRCRVHDAFFYPDAALGRATFAIVSGNASTGIGRRRPLRASQADLYRNHFEVVSDTLPRWTPRLFGIRLSTASYGYGFVVYRRAGSPTTSPTSDAEAAVSRAEHDGSSGRARQP